MLKTAFVLLLLTTAPAMAFEKGFLSSWAPDAATCADEDANGRFTVGPKKMDGRELLCDLKWEIGRAHV